MAKRNQYVSIKVDKNYFDKVFEPERRKLSNRLGFNFTQPKFTSYLHKSGATIKYPKRKNTYSPTKFKNSGIRNFGF